MNSTDLDLLFNAISCYLPYEPAIEQEELDDGPLDLDGLRTGQMLVDPSDYENGCADHDFGFHCVQDDWDDWHSAYETPPKPYLFTFEDMPDRDEYNTIKEPKSRHLWLLKHRIDIFGLIPKGLAIAVTEDNNPY